VVFQESTARDKLGFLGSDRGIQMIARPKYKHHQDENDRGNREYWRREKALDDVRFGSKADMCVAKGDVRFTPESDTKCDICNVR
jgi:hypothetical protein